MSLNEVIVEGTLKTDGTLVLDQKPNLSPGRVLVVLRQESAATQPSSEDWWQFMQRTRSELKAAGCRFMNDEEVKAHTEWLRESDPIDDLLVQADGDQQKRE